MRVQLDQQIKATEEATAKYHTELQSHAVDIERYNAVNTKLLSLTAEYNAASEKASSAIKSLETSRSSWKEEKDLLIAQNKEMDTKFADLFAQNEVLHSQIEALTVRNSKLEQSSANLMPMTETDEDRQLLNKELVDLRTTRKYLRDMLSQATVKHDSTCQELLTAQQRLQYQEKDLAMAMAEAAEYKRRALEYQNSSEHQALVEQALRVKIMEESNSTLRLRVTSSEERVIDLQKITQELQSRIEPLQNQVSSLTTQLETTKQDLERARETAEKWEKRTSAILTKYDVIHLLTHTYRF